MTNQFSSSPEHNALPSPVQLELLEALLQPEDATYPWDITDAESEAYFLELEQELMQDNWLEEEIAARSPSFFNHLENLWSATTPSIAPPVSELQTILQQRYAALIPENWLQTIAQKACQVLATPQSIADQLVQCVQELLPNLVEEDLLILARPYAYVMRSVKTEAIESVLHNVRSQDFSSLSEIEQARIGLAIARDAIAEVQQD